MLADMKPQFGREVVCQTLVRDHIDTRLASNPTKPKRCRVVVGSQTTDEISLSQIEEEVPPGNIVSSLCCEKPSQLLHSAAVIIDVVESITCRHSQTEQCTPCNRLGAFDLCLSRKGKGCSPKKSEVYSRLGQLSIAAGRLTCLFVRDTSRK